MSKLRHLYRRVGCEAHGCTEAVHTAIQIECNLLPSRWGLTFNISASQGCLPSLPLCSLFMLECKNTHSSNSVISFADNMTLMGLIIDNDEMTYTGGVGSILASSLPSTISPYGGGENVSGHQDEIAAMEELYIKWWRPTVWSGIRDRPVILISAEVLAVKQPVGLSHNLSPHNFLNQS